MYVSVWYNDGGMILLVCCFWCGVVVGCGEDYNDVDDDVHVVALLSLVVAVVSFIL